MALDPQLLAILADPQDKGPLYYIEDENCLYNPRLKHCYCIKDDIPVMLIDQVMKLDDAENARVQAKVDSQGIKPTF